VSKDLAQRIGPRLHADPGRVIGQLFVPGEESPQSRSRATAVLGRLLTLDEDAVVAQLGELLPRFAGRHDDLNAMLLRHFSVASHGLQGAAELSTARKLLVGACFTSEYSPEAAALFNPAMAMHPNQDDLRPGELRFVMTVRCLGEGHISSIGFRTGVLGPAGTISIDTPSTSVGTGDRVATPYSRRLFATCLAERGVDRDSIELIMRDLPDEFGLSELINNIEGLHTHSRQRETVQRAIESANTVAETSYAREFSSAVDLSGRLLWPGCSTERHGMEDARLVRFVDDDGGATYYATYTAYDGAQIATHLLETTDLQRFVITPVAGRAARNKGLALFPRQVGGRYLALSRWDRESLAIVDSDDLRVWDQPRPLYGAEQGWEVVQIGNGGSPIETPEGWLVLTHGVGPMRAYSLGAILLDLDDPSRIRATLPRPLLTPNAEERDGYVPNVVYTCGALFHDGVVTIPYGISDMAIGFAQLDLPELLGRMVARSA